MTVKLKQNPVRSLTRVKHTHRRRDTISLCNLCREHIIIKVYKTTCIHNKGSFDSYKDVFVKVIIRFRKIIIRVITEKRCVGNQKGDHEKHVNVGNINPTKYFIVEV
jgi:hypothetical protein